MATSLRCCDVDFTGRRAQQIGRSSSVLTQPRLDPPPGRSNPLHIVTHADHAISRGRYDHGECHTTGSGKIFVVGRTRCARCGALVDMGHVPPCARSKQGRSAWCW